MRIDFLKYPYYRMVKDGECFFGRFIANELLTAVLGCENFLAHELLIPRRFGTRHTTTRGENLLASSRSITYDNKLKTQPSVKKRLVIVIKMWILVGEAQVVGKDPPGRDEDVVSLFQMFD